MKLIVASIPLFFILIGIELLASRVLHRSVYAFADTLADLGCGIIEQLFSALVKTALFAAYLWIYANGRLFELSETSWLVFGATFIAVDFFYYWFHRTSHEIGALWAAHSVHHQSEEYNLAVALRQGSFQGLFSWAFYLPLALVGVPPEVFITCSALNTLYQFWIHTRLIGKLGPVEWIFNTPSHHRVHHARNPRYIDRNHAGVLIIWDRMFGTFVEEQDEPVYGVVKPLRSVNPLWANFATWKDLFAVAARAPSFTDRGRVFLAAPGWRPAELGGPHIPPEVSRPKDAPEPVPVSRGLGAWVFANFVLMLLLAAAALRRYAALDLPTFCGIAAVVTLSLVVLSGLLERKAWARPAEGVRLVALAALAAGPGLETVRLLLANS